MQSSRGEALTGDSPPASPSPVRTPALLRRGATPLLVGIAATVLCLDQITKHVAVARLGSRAPIDVIDGIFTLRLVRNPGAAFGLASEFTIVLPLLAVVVCVAILRTTRRLRSVAWTVGLALLLGGALGNLTDRIFRSPGVLRGHVVDFLELPRWPVFNVADIAIVSSAVLLAVLSVAGRELDGTTAGRPRRAERDSADD